jgi:hypothetical protein
MPEVINMRPTDQAKFFFSAAANKAIKGVTTTQGLSPAELADVLHKLAAGMEELAVGLRATYMLLEKKN